MIYIDDVLYPGAMVAPYNGLLQVNLESTASFSELEQQLGNARKVEEKNSSSIEVKCYFLRGIVGIERQGNDRAVLTYIYSLYDEKTAEEISQSLNSLDEKCETNNSAIASAIHDIGEHTNEIQQQGTTINTHTSEIQENATGLEDQLVALFEVGDLINDLEQRVAALEGK